MSTSHQPPEPGSRVALHLRMRRRLRRRPRRRARPAAPAAAATAPADPPRSDPPAQPLRAAAPRFAGALRQPGAVRPWEWSLAGLLVLAIAFGLGRLSKAPEPDRRPPPPASAPAREAPRADLEPGLPEPPALRPERADDPGVFLDPPPGAGLPDPGEHEVLCIRKPERRSSRKRIEQIGGRRFDSAPWRLTLDQAISGLESGRWTFRVGRGPGAARVGVEVSRAGNKFLKTRDDGRAGNNLLSLPECP